MDILVVVAQAIKVDDRRIHDLETKALAAPCMVGEIIIKVLIAFSLKTVYLTKAFLFLDTFPLLVF